jgi:small subunit ribosomal protein S6
MSDQKAKYEGMFLLDAGNPDFQAATEPVRTVLDRHEATTLAIKPWDERRLAYEIRGRRRGLYVLSYFEVDPLKIAEIEHDCHLDERIVRMLVLRRDEITDEVINAETPASSSHKRAERRDDESEPESDRRPRAAKPDEDTPEASKKTDDEDADDQDDQDGSDDEDDNDDDN